jgi:hypothetical protein
MRSKILLGGILILILTGAAIMGGLLSQRRGQAVTLATFTESGVQVQITWEETSEGAFLQATFSPTEDGFHLYSKDLARDGVDGLGRPTLLELTPANHLKSRGPLAEVGAPSKETFSKEYPDQLVYPAGAVTLRLPVQVTADGRPVDDQVSVTYMACRGTKCLRPVEGKIVAIQIP